MIETGRVLKRLDGGRVEVEVVRHEDCGECKICANLAGDGPNTVIADNPIGADEGECVRIEIEPKRMVGLSALVFLFPILAFVAGYVLVAIFVGQGTAGQTALGVAGGAVLLVLSFFPAIRIARNSKTPLVRVVERVEPPA
ncbi:MAG TPA: SoxR reducing system RseC family protein [bacterium]|nr:SoxR reducing system RseC family protein [bacterium]